MRRFLLYTALALYFSVFLQPPQIVMANGCSINREALCSHCHLNNRCHATARLQRQNSGSFVIKRIRSALSG